MINIQQLIDRYKNLKDPRFFKTVTGYLSLGGHNYYLINSEIPLSINSDGNSEFITNELGQVEHYELTDKKAIVNYFRDDDTFLIPVTEEEIKKEGLERYIDYFPNYDNTPCSRHWYGEAIDKYYIHPWFPDKNINSFEIIRLLPGCLVGDIILVNPFNQNLYHYLHNYKVDFCLQYPEFFRPIYGETLYEKD